MKTLRQKLVLTAAASVLSFTAMAAQTATRPTVVVTEQVTTEQFGPAPVHGLSNPALLAQLNLTAAQKNQIQKIRTQYQPQGEIVLTADDRMLQSLRQQRHDLIANKDFDEAKARNILTQESQILARKQKQRMDNELTRLKQDHAIYQVLTPKQRTQLLKQRVKSW